MLKCPIGDEADYAKKYQDFAVSENLQEVVCFQYQRMLRYGGEWHLERRPLLPGCIFLSGDMKNIGKADADREGGPKSKLSLIPCEIPFWKMLCQKDNLIVMSRGIIKDGNLVVTSGPLKGYERLIRKIDRHKRIAEIEVSLAGEETRVTVGLEIYQKQI